MRVAFNIFQYQCSNMLSMNNYLFNKIILSVVFCLLTVPNVVQAAVVYTVSPLVLDATLEARDIVTKQITITNSGDQLITLYPTVNNVSVQEGERLDPFFSPSESDRTASLAAWIEISRQGIDLMPGSSRTIDITLRIHPQPRPGTYHAFIGFGNGGNRDEAEKQVQGGTAPGTLVTVTIEDKKNVVLKLSNFFIQRFVTKPDNQAAVYLFNNPGDEALIPTGEIILYDGTGKEVVSLPVNPENVSIPPGGQHSFVSTVPIEGLFGKYKAFLSVEYGNSQRGSINDTNFFYVFPLQKLLIILGVVLVCVLFGAWHVHKRYLPDEIAESDQLSFHVRDSRSEPKDHDLNLKRNE